VLILDDARAVLEPVRAEFYPEGVAAGIPLHLTLLFPFVPIEAVDEEQLAGFFAGYAPLAFSLTRLAEFPGVVYAVPDPDSALLACMRDLWALFPDTPPYEGEFAEVVPHATLAEVPAGDDQERIAAEIRSRLAGQLPIECRVDDASLLEEYEPERWREARRFPFRKVAA